MKYIPIFAILLLTGCASADYAVSKGAEAFDKGLEGAQWFVCEGASVGSVKRMFNTEEAAKAYKEFCLIGNKNVDIIGL